MSITPINKQAMSFSPATYNKHNAAKTDAGNAKPLTNEVESAVKVSFSSEAIDLSVSRLGELKTANLPQSTIRMVDFQVKLMQQLKTQRLTEQSSGDEIKDLASAYAVVSSNLNENSENSQKHVKFLDDAFKAVSDLFFTSSAQQEIKNSAFTESLKSGVADKNLNAMLEKAVDNAKKESATFSEAFLKNFKKLGLEGAFNHAMSLL